MIGGTCAGHIYTGLTLIPPPPSCSSIRAYARARADQARALSGGRTHPPPPSPMDTRSSSARCPVRPRVRILAPYFYYVIAAAVSTQKV